ncbi:RmlC-like cupin [Microstroma glucosiphilum]|uniref:RmlC-like cupin n=1 Tax=Pseudomicrostroma glucosiphilum TaxID=1684307 RepID=A0A316U6N4_9BASI|nr:RmlC-like cupin [Pseudomicrostroma glucosiphilum]PWN20906.1 RmlC-like cupin [Pseudomicrostroma glucosiphilum]
MSTATTTSLNSTASSCPPPSAQLRKWNARMHDDHGWLKTFLTFSFAGHHDPKWDSFGPLRVVNEDRIEAGTGFPPHSHASYEIFSYVLSGELTHRDSMGNLETLKRGEIQYTRAGTGIKHSEYNNQKGGAGTHFMQIWFIPTREGQRMSPTYFSTQSPAELKQDKLLTLIRPHWSLPAEQQSTGGLLQPGQPIPAQASLVVRAAVLSPSSSAGGDATQSAGVTHTWGQDTDVESSTGEERWGVIHLAMNSGYKDPKSRTASGVGAKPDESKVRVELLSGEGEMQGEGYELTEGDALFVKGARVGQQVRVKHLAGREAEFLLFDLQRG